MEHISTPWPTPFNVSRQLLIQLSVYRAAYLLAWQCKVILLRNRNTLVELCTFPLKVHFLILLLFTFPGHHFELHGAEGCRASYAIGSAQPTISRCMVLARASNDFWIGS